MRKSVIAMAALCISAAWMAPEARGANGGPFGLNSTVNHDYHIMMGAHPVYNHNLYSGIWTRKVDTGTDYDYMLLMSANNTFLNAGTWVGLVVGNQNYNPTTMNFAATSDGFFGATRVGGLPSFALDLSYRAQLINTSSYMAGIWYGEGTTQQMLFGLKFIGPEGKLIDEIGLHVNALWRFSFNGADSAFKAGGSSTWSVLLDSSMEEGRSFDLGLAELEKIQPIRFRYNGLAGTRKDGRQYVGVKAEDLEKIAPFMVSDQTLEVDPKIEGDEKGEEMNVKFVDPSAFQQMLVNAVQELSAKNKKLKSRLCSHGSDLEFCK